jgi:L-malate glycosyltransferase
VKICHIGWANSIHVERLMRWFAKKDYGISIITDNPKEIEGVKTYVIPKSFGEDTRPRWKRYMRLSFNDYRIQKLRYPVQRIIWIRNLVKEIKPDIIHSHSLWYPGYLGVYLIGYPFILTVLNGDVLWKKDDIDIYTKLRTKWGIRKANLVTGESEELMNACVKHGAKIKKVYVMRNWGVNFELFNCNESKIEIRRKLGLPESSKIILSPRNTADFYNLDKIVRAISVVNSKVKDAYFVFIWHGNNTDKEKELKDLASQLGVQKAIKIIGFVNYDKVALYHKASDVMVSVSRYDSGPMALQEAMACGDVPVISNLPCVREWITGGWNGLLVEPNNVNQIAESIIDLLSNDTKRKNFAERNWKLIQEKGNQDYWMEKVEKLYYSLVKE